MNLQSYYDVIGEGAPVVLIHGSYASTSTWKQMVADLSLRYKCILFKLPGHCGLADPDDFASPQMSTELSLLHEVIDAQAKEPVHLIGHSYGGVVALAYALEALSPLRALTLYEPVATWILELVGNEKELRLVNGFLRKYRQDLKDNVPEAGGQLIDFWCDSAVFHKIPDPVRAKLLTLQRNNLRHWDLCTRVSHSVNDLQGLRVATSLVVGADSVSVAHGIIDALLELLPNARKTVIPEANHLLVTTHSDACLSAL